ncbi:flagellar export chaperone FliS [Baekduia soli]|uniref:Flagellar secretion chaperone FliS n=1 Tax=Baekduia soli TaxID=496014 RepID=A0A5B8U1E9_9ACTN|nr:flagellar export chaperone FliS [Baekduia soli]QEC46831.1 flagellar export chaperone FliS [Baekduia soli]
MNPYGNPQAYRDSAVLTASPEQLVVMLYDGAVRFLRQGEVAMGEGAVLHAGAKLTRAEAIIDELLATLNMDTGEIAERLQAIYVFCKRTLIEARIQRSAEKIGQVAALLTSLREAWAKLAEQAAARPPAPASA